MEKTYKNILDLDEFLKNKNIAIFDFDGTISNTEIFHLEAYCITLKELYNVELDKKTFKKYLGHKENEIYKMIEKDFNIVLDEKLFMQKRISTFFKLVKENNLKLNNFFVDFLKNYKMELFLLTSQKKEVVEKMFQHLNISNIFDFDRRIYVYNTDFTKIDVLKNPEKFLKVRNLKKESIVIFEDSYDIIKSAQDNNYFVVSILHDLNDHILNIANTILISKLN